MGSSIGRWLDATGTADHLRTTLDSAADLTPDTSASVLRIAKRTGVPAHVVESDLDGFRRDTERVADPLQLTTKAPKVAAWLAESPYHAAAARDDLEQLAQLEDVVRGAGFFRNLGKGLGTGAVALEGGVGNVLEAAGRSVPESGGPGTLMVSGFATIAKGLGGLLKRDAEENREFYTPRVASYQGVSSGGDLRDYLAFQLGQGAGSMLAVAGGFLTGGPAGAVAVGGTMAFGDVREEIAELDADTQEGVKNALALALAVPIAALDRITPGQIASKLLARGAAESVVREAAQYGMTRQVAGAVLKSAVTEGGTEVGQEIIQYLGTRAGTGTPMSAEEGGVRAVDAFIGGALGGGAFSASVEVPRVRQAMRNQRFFQRLGEVAGQSKLAQRLPEAMEQVVQQMTADGPVETVYADAQQWTAYFQGIGLDPAQVADDVIGEGGRAWYEEAVATGGRLAIPTSRYAVTLAPSEHHGALMPDLAFDPDELTAREAEQVAKQVMAESEQPAAEQGDTTPEVEQVLADRLAQTGRYRTEDAAVLAQQMGAFLRTVGGKVSRDPMELLSRYGLDITSGEAQQAAELASEQGPLEGEFWQSYITTLSPEESQALLAQLSGTGFASEQGQATVVVPQGQRIVDGDDTVSVMARAIKTVGRQQFQQMAQAEIAKRGESSDLDVQKAAIEQTARQIVAGEISYQQAAFNGPRGRIRIDKRTRQMAIDLFESADFSTFLHESGHFYLEVLRDLSGESEQLAADAQAILKFLGVQQFSEIQREHHEQFARAMEAYFMEGNAPSVQLRRAFYRFKLWLQTLYRSVSTLDVTLTREIRDVFDRLFASEAEIDAAENEAGVAPIFTTAKDAGMSETEFAAYRQTVEDAHREASERLTTKLMREMQREQEAWWQEQRAQVRAEVEAEIDQQPVYQALQALQRGVTVDGATIKVKLDKADLVARKGKDFLKALPRPYVYAQDGGLNADAVAEQFGFSSGDELLQALAGATPRPQAIEAETDRRMTERHGNMRVDGSIADEAELAVMDDHRDKIIRAELRALNALARTVKPHVQAERAEQRQRREQGRQILAGVPSEESTKRIAQARIAMLRVRDIKPYPYWVAARKASKQAQDALAKQDYVATANAKQAELLNLALYREAQRVLAEVDSVATYARRLQQPASQRRIGKAGADYLDQINKLLERFDFRPLSNVGIDRRASLAAFIKREEEAGREVLIPEELVNEAFKKPWRMMTPEELLGIRDVLRHVEHLARTKNRLLAEKAERELNEAAATLSASITAHAKRELPVDLEPRLPGTERTRTVADFFASHRKLSSLVREMDGHQDGGAMWDLILRPLNEAADQHAVMQQAINGKLWGLFEGAYSKAEMAAMYRKEYQPPIKASLSKMARLMVALNWGALDNREKLLAGLQQQHPQITAADIEAIIDTLDKRDMDFVQGVWDLMDEYWPPMKALMEQMDGVAAEKIPAAEVVTRHGTYRGGYFRLKYDSRISKRAGVHEAMTEASKLVRGAAMRASTKAGSRNERVNVSDQFVRLDFGVIFEHFEEVALDLTHTAPLYDVNRLLNHDAVWGAIGTHYGDVVRNQIKNTLTDIAAGDVPAKDGVDKALNWVRSGSSIAAMGWNMMTAAIQVTGYTQSIVRLGGDQGGVAGARWMWKGLSRWLRDPRTMNDTVTMIHEKSAFMRLRGTTQMREIREIQGKLGMRTGKLATWMDLKLDAATAGKVDMQTVQDSFFWFIAKMQMAVDVPTWLGAYEKAMADPANDEARAIALADQAVIDSQTSGLIKDLAGVQRGPAWKKLWTNFYSFFSAAYNLNVEAVARTKFTDPASVGRLTVDLMLINILPAVLGKAIRDALRGNDDEDEPEAYAREVLGFFAGQLLLLRELGGAINGFAGYEGPAGARFFSELNKLAGQLQQGDIDRALARAANQTAGILFHYPATFVQRIGDGLMAMQSGITSSPTALLFGPPRQ